MSSTINRFKRADAQMAAMRVINLVRDLVDRIEEVGSRRRGSAEVGDIELLAIPRGYRNLFGETKRDTEPISKALHTAGFEILKGGEKYIQFIMPLAGSLRIPVDLFLTTPEQFGIIQIIRTGPADFSHQFVTSYAFGGWMPANYRVQDGWLTKDGEPVITREEEDVFRAIGREWISPRERR